MGMHLLAGRLLEAGGRWGCNAKGTGYARASAGSKRFDCKLGNRGQATEVLMAKMNLSTGLQTRMYGFTDGPLNCRRGCV